MIWMNKWKDYFLWRRCENPFIMVIMVLSLSIHSNITPIWHKRTSILSSVQNIHFLSHIFLYFFYYDSLTVGAVLLNYIFYAWTIPCFLFSTVPLHWRFLINDLRSLSSQRGSGCTKDINVINAYQRLGFQQPIRLIMAYVPTNPPTLSLMEEENKTSLSLFDTVVS